MSRSNPTEDVDDLESAQTPFLSNSERKENHSDHEQISTKGEEKCISRRWLEHQTIFHSIVYILAIWGLVSLAWQAAGTISAGSSFSRNSSNSQPEYDVYRPETLAPGLNECDCGPTTADALARDCKYDSLSTAWLPPYCRDDELTAEFDRSGPGPDGSWGYFADEAGTIPLSADEVAALGETGGSFWASRDWHVVHCLYYWRKYARMRHTGAVMEARFDNEAHVEHCTRLIRKPAPDYFFLIEVPVMMNSSDHHHRAEGS
ncbi:hypothetical protein PFICI_04781 [Pestalotiopsis fici W106-1]|uniref:Uncharacterized protein n=1 Tax=Pestalotiopsis fici (strain W106-1 / CGMCC3.15140) TaxID=1229662 RepID=W3XA17_PESFW|nr:uncharacterized protein PFICI_04781 [Pestalotiopsis fici W106-1]ETS82905.1 hypothetical protein PFICI_04781 [Pestalotiopsis fici W106-1]